MEETRTTAVAKAPSFLPGVLPANSPHLQIWDAVAPLAEREMRGRYDLGGKDVPHSRVLVLDPVLAIHLKTHPQASEWNQWIPLSPEIEEAPLLYGCNFHGAYSLLQKPVRFKEEIVSTHTTSVQKLAMLADKVPSELLDCVMTNRISRHHPEIAVFATHIPDFITILWTNPQLGLLYLRSTFSGSLGKSDVERMRHDVRSGPREMLRRLRLADRPLTLEILRRLRIDDLPSLDALKTVFEMPKGLENLENLRSFIRKSFIEFLAGAGTMLTQPILKHLNGAEPLEYWRTQNIDLYLDDADQVAHHLWIAQDCTDMLDTFGRERSEMTRLRSPAALERLHDELAAMTRSNRNRKMYGEETPLPCPVLSLPEEVTPLETVGKLIDQAHEFQNCSAYYIEQILAGQYYLFWVDRLGERIMVGLRISENRFELEQMFGPCNRPVSRQNGLWIRDWATALPMAVTESKGYLSR